MKKLPAKYYHDHFNEFLDYVTGPCKHLLAPQHQAFVSQYQQLPEDAQCLVARTANRKLPVFKAASMDYPEIQHYQQQLELLVDSQLLHTPGVDDISPLAQCMTRQELVVMLRQWQPQSLSGVSKGELVMLACAQVSDENLLGYKPLQHYLARSFDTTLRYFLFLYFDNLHGRLNQFSMRDLGIMRTRKGEGKHLARFADLRQAQSAFSYACHLRELADATPAAFQLAYQRLADMPPAEGDRAVTYRHRYLYRLGVGLIAEDRQAGCELLAQSNLPEAQERWIRERYKDGGKQQVRAALERILDDPDSEQLLLFAEDFLARKYHSKKTSLVTDMLRRSSRQLDIDEIYRDSIEAGVVDHYRNRDICAFHTENRLWRALFGLTFWSLLFDDNEAALATEFDRQPRMLRDNGFYQRCGDGIEQRLAQMTDARQAITQLTATATRHYGKVNGIFHWHPDQLEVLASFITATDMQSVTTHLRQMCINYRELSDGYPDLMVMDGDNLRFEEVKGPGDQLRKNQFVTIRQLQSSGFNVQITRVNWCFDPQQPYVVVDVETTGGRASQHRVTEIGMVKVVAGEVVERWQSLINPQRHIPQAITQLTGIDNEMVSDAPVFAEVMEEVREFLAGTVFVAHNVNFDYGFIKQEFARQGEVFAMPKFCTCSEMRKVRPGLGSYSLANLAAAFDIDMQQHHRALSDALAASELLKIINQHRSDAQQK